MKLDGLPVLDAKVPITFGVTQRDIDRGGVKEPDSCAIALGVMREARCKAAKIHLSYSYILEKDHWLRYRTPSCITREIIAFDRGGKFEPGEYTLLVPFKSNRLGVRPFNPQKHLNRRLKRSIHITANVRTRPAYATRVLDD